MELRENQNAYDKLVDETVVKSKLEVEKDNEWDNYASSLRYTIRRLINGVSSSRVCARK